MSKQVILMQSDFVRDSKFSYNETVLTIVLKKLLSNATHEGTVKLSTLSKRCGFHNNYHLMYDTISYLSDNKVITVNVMDKTGIDIKLELNVIANSEYHGSYKSRFIRIPSILFDDDKIWKVISKKQLKILLCLSTWGKDKSAGFDITTLPVSLSVIAEYLNISLRQLNNHIANLKESGIIESINVGSRYGNSYIVKWAFLIQKIKEVKD